MNKIVRSATADLVRENTQLKANLNYQKVLRQELENAVIELGELFAEQEDALVELAGLMEE